MDPMLAPWTLLSRMRFGKCVISCEKPNTVILRFTYMCVGIVANLPFAQLSGDFEVLCSWNHTTWWRHRMETFSALLAICVGNSPVSVEFPAQRPVTRSFRVFFDLRPNERLSKHSWGGWLETPSSPLWRHSDTLRKTSCNLLRATPSDWFGVNKNYQL